MSQIVCLKVCVATVTIHSSRYMYILPCLLETQSNENLCVLQKIKQKRENCWNVKNQINTEISNYLQKIKKTKNTKFNLNNNKRWTTNVLWHTIVCKYEYVTSRVRTIGMSALVHMTVRAN